MAKRIVDEEMRFSIIVNGDEAQKELYELEKSNRDLTKSNKELRAERVKLFRQGKRGSAEYKRLSAEINKNAEVMRKNKNRMNALQKEIGITGLTMKQLRQRASKLRLQLDNMIPGSAAHNKLQAELKQTTAQMTKLRAASGQASRGLGGFADKFNRFAALGASVIATITGIVFSIQQMIDFNGKLADAQSDVRKTTGMTKKEVDDLAKSFGVLKTRTGRINLLKIAEEGGRIGIVKEEIGDFVNVMNKAAVALGDSFPGGVEEVASKLGKLKTLFKETKDLSVEEAYNSIGSSINELGANGVATEGNIADFATRVGSLPDAIKPSIGDALALGAAFEESGVKSEIAGRGYNIALKAAAENSDKFAKVMGISNKEVKALINKDPLEFMIRFSKGMKGMNATDTANTLKYLGINADGANKIIGALSNNTDRFREMIQLSSNAMQEATSLTDEYDIKNNNLAATLEKVSKRIRGAFASETVVNFLNGAVTWFSKFIGATDDAEGSVVGFREKLVFLLKIISIITAAILSYNSAVKLTALFTNKAYQATKLYTLAQKVSAVTTNTLTSATLLAKAAYLTLTGNIRKARAMLRLFNMTAKVNPWGALLAVISAATVAYFAFRKENNLLVDLHKEVAKSVAKERSELDSLLKVARSEHKSKAERLDAIDKINKIAPEYLDNITLENINTKETTKAIDKYIEALNKKALSQAAASKKQELFAKRIEKENEALSAGGLDTSGFWELFGIESKDFNGIQELNNYLKESVKNGEMSAETAESIKQSYGDVIAERKEDLKAIDDQIAALDKYIDVSDKAKKSNSTDKENETKSTFTPIQDKEDSSDSKSLFDLEKEQEEYLKIRRANAEAKEKLNDDEFTREINQLELQHQEKMRQLRNKLIEERELKELQKKITTARSNGDNETADNYTRVLEIWVKKNEAIKAQLQSEEMVHQLEIGKIVENGQENKIENLQESYNREKIIRQTAFNNELNKINSLAQAKNQLRKTLSEEELSKIKTLEQAKEALKKEFEKNELERKATHLRDLISQMESMMDSGQFEGFELDLLPEEQKQEMLNRLNELKLALSLIAQEKAKLTGSGQEDSLLGSGGDEQITDIFGMTADDWGQLFQNLKEGKDLISTMSDAANVLMSTWKAYSDYKTAQENRDMQKFEEHIDEQIQKEERKLNRGLINQRQYDRTVQELEEQRKRKKAELEYKQAKRNKAIAISEAIISTSLAIMQAFAQLGPIAGAVAAAFIGTTGALQIATIAQQPLPAKGYQEGYYPVEREQDGKLFNARFGGKSRSGIVDEPTVFMAGEEGKDRPEMIINGTDYSNFTPEFKESLHNEIARVKGYQEGFYKSSTQADAFNEENKSSTDENYHLIDAINKNTEVLDRIQKEGIPAFMARTMKNARYMNEDLKKYNKTRNNAKA